LARTAGARASLKEPAVSVLDEPLRFDVQTWLAAARPGLVSLAGAGPGDPDLLTVKAARALAQAQVVLYDALVSEAVLALLPRQAQRIYVGKRSGCHALSQQGIIELMIRIARSGKPVLRLKGGDPFIFGRGGEEAQALAAAGVPFEIVPGISAAQGAGAALGLPLTHRDHACALVLATAHLRAGADGSDQRTPDLDWELLARPRQTVVLYMGVGALPQICEQLMAHGLSAQTPAATVERASCPDQRLVAGTLETLPALAQVHGVQPPALIIIGGVVAVQAELAATLQRAGAPI
jgi:uroporphyrin-III C-methyltransferase